MKISIALNNSINTLNDVSQRENQGKSDLESSVTVINKGFEDLQFTSESLNNILEEFKNVSMQFSEDLEVYIL